MADTLIKPTAFPGGLADASFRHACVRYRLGRLVAVELGSGATLWRTGEAYRPLLATGEELIAVSDQSLRCVALRWDAGGDASPQWTSDVLPLPDWACASGTDLALSAQMQGSAIEVAWTARTRYKGGAAPSPRALAEAKRDASGAFTIDRASGAVAPVASTDLVCEPEPPPPAGADPRVLQQARHADRIYELLVERDVAAVRTVLRALEATGRPVWRIVVDEGPARAPRALRP